MEPFCGGLAVALNLLPDEALLNDINPHLINFYQWLKQGLRRRGVTMLESESVYYENRARFNALLTQGKHDTRQAALLFYYLNRTGYNGLCRFSRQGRYNVPFGRYAKVNYAKDFTPYGKAFKNWDFLNVDFENLRLRKDDFVYADPPYDVEFTQYAKEGFSWKDQNRLVKWLVRHKGPVVLSNQATTRIMRLYEENGFDIHLLRAPRRISCNGDRTPAREVLATRNI